MIGRLIILKSATKPLNVLIAFTRPLITEFTWTWNTHFCLQYPLPHNGSTDIEGLAVFFYFLHDFLGTWSTISSEAIDSEPILFKSLKEPLQRVLLMETKVFAKPDEQSSVYLSSAMARQRAMKWNDLHLGPRVESITDDNVVSNCSTTRK